MTVQFPGTTSHCPVSWDHFSHPVSDETCVLSRRDLQAFVKPAWPKMLGPDHEFVFHPFLD